MLLYHYTPIANLRRIVADGVIRAHSQTLYRDMCGLDPGPVVGPHVWLTENPLGEATAGAKMRADGYRGDGAGSRR